MTFSHRFIVDLATIPVGIVTIIKQTPEAASLYRNDTPKSLA